MHFSSLFSLLPLLKETSISKSFRFLFSFFLLLSKTTTLSTTKVIMASLPLPFAQKRRRSPLLDLSPSVQLRTEEETSLSRPIKCAKLKKKVSFKYGDGEPKVHLFDPDNGHGSVPNKIIGNCIVIDDDDDDDDDLSHQQQLPLTAELTVLSTVHGRQRRELRDITKHDLRTVMKYGKSLKVSIDRIIASLKNSQYFSLQEPKPKATLSMVINAGSLSLATQYISLITA